MSERPWQVTQTRLVHGLLDEYAELLSPVRLASVTELLHNDEPNEALLEIADDLAAMEASVPHHVAEAIAEAVGDPRQLPPRFGRGERPPDTP